MVSMGLLGTNGVAKWFETPFGSRFARLDGSSPRTESGHALVRRRAELCGAAAEVVSKAVLPRIRSW